LAPNRWPEHFINPWDTGGGWNCGSALHTQCAQTAQGRCLQSFMEDGHSAQLTLQGCGAAPLSVLGSCKGGADAALLQGGHQPRPPAQPCGGWNRLGAGEGGVSGDWWRRQSCGGGRCAVPSRANTTGGERLQSWGWGIGQITAQPGTSHTSSSSWRPPMAAQTPEAEV
jgi:hypothetical protein